MNLGSRIKSLRNKKKLTQRELADKIFVTDKAISSWESNRTEPNLEIILKLSEILECSISFLVYGNIKQNKIETDIKIKLTENEYQRLEIYMNKNAKFIKEINQLDTYYEPSHRKFLKNNDEMINEWLRIGIRGSKKILNYKYWHNNMYCDEYEVEINDENNLDKILKILGLYEIAYVNKTRKTYFYLNKYEVALDHVENLGYFVEIEVKNYDKEASLEYDDLIKIAVFLNLNLSNIDKRGYPYYLIHKKQ